MTEEKNTSFIIPEEPPVEKDKNKMKNNKKRIRNVSTTLYIWLTIIGIVLIGLGCGISVFELSEYKIANYRAIPMDTSLPQVEKQTITLEASYQNGEQFKLDSNDWHISSYDIQYDNSLKDKVIIEVTAPKDLYHAYLITQNENHYYLQLNEDITGALRFVLQMAKEGYIPENPPPVTLTLTMSEAQAKNFKLNEERYKEQETRQSYNEQLNEVRNEYNEQLNNQRNEYTEQLNDMRTQYDQQLNDLREEHTQQIQNIQEEHNTRIEEQREQYEQRITDLEQQLNDARTALS